MKTSGAINMKRRQTHSEYAKKTLTFNLNQPDDESSKVDSMNQSKRTTITVKDIQSPSPGLGAQSTLSGSGNKRKASLKSMRTTNISPTSLRQQISDTFGGQSPTQRSLRLKDQKQPPKTRPQEPFAKRITAYEKRAVAIDKERSEREKLINLDDFFKKEDDDQEQQSFQMGGS